MIHKVELVLGYEVILCGWIVGIQAKRIISRHELTVHATKLTVCTRIVKIPGKLLADAAANAAAKGEINKFVRGFLD